MESDAQVLQNYIWERLQCLQYGDQDYAEVKRMAHISLCSLQFIIGNSWNLIHQMEFPQVLLLFYIYNLHWVFLATVYIKADRAINSKAK